MSARYLEVAQDDVIWGNLNINPYQQRARYAISWAMTIGLIILWSFPGALPPSSLSLSLARAQS